VVDRRPFKPRVEGSIPSAPTRTPQRGALRRRDTSGAAGTLPGMETEEAHRRLQEERVRLEGLRSNFDDEHLADQSEGESLGELSSLDQHQADLGTETFERAKDLAILERVEAELAAVEHAVRRLEDGTYGTCEVCGREIDEERLRALPATRLCLEHQAAAEREARGVGNGDTGSRPGLA
jgi:RNA polymerase-binding transcription factor DksA